MSRAQVPGFDYVAGKPVAMTAAEWRTKYGPDDYQRTAAAGETAYRAQRLERGTHVPQVFSWHLQAEAYAIIPAGRHK